MKYIIIVLISLSTCFAWNNAKYKITHYTSGPRPTVYEVNQCDTQMSSVKFIYKGNRIELFGNFRILERIKRK